MDHNALVRELDRLVAETCNLWDVGWVTFNWRNYTCDHVRRVRALTTTLCSREGGDLAVCDLASLLHDITKPYDGEYVVDAEGKRAVDADGYWRNAPRPPARSNEVTDLYDALGLAGELHNASGAVVALYLLRRRGVDADTCERVAQTIRDHLKPPDDAPVESRCLSDADTIDANIGLPAFVRNIYIHLHFRDQRLAPGDVPTDRLLREAPLDGQLKVKSADALAMTLRLNREFGLLVGTSSGANVAAALELARRLEPASRVVTLLCDRAERYFSTRLFASAEAEGRCATS